MNTIEPADLRLPSASAGNYWCFISYRHDDNRRDDRGWATWLHQEIERYEVPAELVGNINERGQAIPERIYPVFRDEESLPANADLSKSIEKALDGSEVMAVICSPRAVESEYVNEEIEYFARIGKGDRILAAIIAGEPGDARMEAFPAALRTLRDDRGRLIEPIAADFRLLDGNEGFTSAEAYRLSLKDLAGPKARKYAEAYDARIQLMKLKIIAGILAVPLETLRDRDKAYQLQLSKKRNRVLIQWLFVVVILGVAAVIAAVYARTQQKLALEQQRKAETTLAENSWNAAINARDRQNEPWSALHHFSAAAAVFPDEDRASKALIAAQALLPALRLEKVSDNVTLSGSFERLLPPSGSISGKGNHTNVKYWRESTNNNSVTKSYYIEFGFEEYEGRPFRRLVERFDNALLFDQDRHLLLTHSDGSFQIWSVPQQRRTALAPPAKYQSLWSWIVETKNNTYIAIETTDEYDANTSIRAYSTYSSAVTVPVGEEEFDTIRLNEDGTLVLTVNGAGKFEIWDGAAGERLRELEIDSSSAESVVVSRDGTRIAVRDAGDVLRLYDTNGVELAELSSDMPIERIGFTRDSRFLIGRRKGGWGNIWTAADGNDLCAFAPSDTQSPAIQLNSVAGIELQQLQLGQAVSPILKPLCAKIDFLDEQGQSNSPETVRGEAEFFISGPFLSSNDIAFSSNDLTIEAVASSDEPRFVLSKHWGLEWVVKYSAQDLIGIFYGLEEAGSTFRLVNANSGSVVLGTETDDPMDRVLAPNEYLRDLIIRPDASAALSVAVGGGGIDGDHYVLRQWSLSTGEQISTAMRLPFSEYGQELPLQVEYGPNSEFIFAVVGKDVLVFDAKTGALLVPRIRHADTVEQVRLLDGSTLLTVTKDGTIHHWNLNTIDTVPPAEWPVLVQLWTGTELNNSGDIQWLSAANWHALADANSDLFETMLALPDS